MTSDTNPAGDIFGGWLLWQMDLAAGNAAARHAQGPLCDHRGRQDHLPAAGQGRRRGDGLRRACRDGAHLDALLGDGLAATPRRRGRAQGDGRDLLLRRARPRRPAARDHAAWCADANRVRTRRSGLCLLLLSVSGNLAIRKMLSRRAPWWGVRTIFGCSGLECRRRGEGWMPRYFISTCLDGRQQKDETGPAARATCRKSACEIRRTLADLVLHGSWVARRHPSRP